MRKINIIIWIIIILTIATSVYIYPKMPDKMASHWNSRGEVDGYMPKFWALSLVPIIAFACFLLFNFLPSVDPLKNNVKKFRGYYEGFILIFVLFMLYIHILTVLWNFNIRPNIILMLVPAFAVLFYYIGILVENAKRNWFIGIKTPWTLSNDRVWNKTHRLAGKLFKISGIISLLGVFLENYALILVLIPAILAGFISIAYSYFEYKKIKK